MFIAIEGCIGAGKTTVAQGLANHRNSSFLLERFEENPFLKSFYDDPIQNALETEFAFLLLHFHQLKALSSAPKNSETIADFHLGKDLIYADLNLKDNRALRLFRALYDLCSESTPHPDLLLFLSISTELLIRRIQTRMREFELKIDLGYYAVVNHAYEQFFEKYNGPKLRLPMDEWDFVHDVGLYRKLDTLIAAELRLA
jgi:deoxyguanosine kinase